MNPSTMLEAVAKVIKNRPVSPSGRYDLYYKDGKVGITPSPSDLPENHIITRADTISLDRGFTKSEWARIARRIVQIKHPCPCQGELNGPTTVKIEYPKKAPEKPD